MNKSIAVKNIVFVGFFQPSKFDKFFFIKNGLVKEDEILEPSVFSPEVVQFRTTGVSIAILLNQIIIHQVDILQDRIDEIAQKLIQSSDLEITAIGINITWNLSPDESLENSTKNFFLNERNEMFSKFFNSDNVMYGAYVSKDISGGRLKLEIKPQVSKRLHDNIEIARFISFAFNYHFDHDKSKNFDTLLNAVKNYKNFIKESEEIMSIYG